MDKQGEKARLAKRKYYEANRDELILKSKERNKKLRLENLERYREYSRVWHKRNRPARNAYIRKKIRDDANYKISRLLSRRVRLALSGKVKCIVDIGCTIEKLKQHLQETAIKNGYLTFNIESYNGKEYHIDHIRPCSSFDLTIEAERQICFNFRNLQILSSSENLKKSNKYDTKTQIR